MSILIDALAAYGTVALLCLLAIVVCVLTTAPEPCCCPIAEDEQETPESPARTTYEKGS